MSGRRSSNGRDATQTTSMCNDAVRRYFRVCPVFRAISLARYTGHRCGLTSDTKEMSRVETASVEVQRRYLASCTIKYQFYTNKAPLTSHGDFALNGDKFRQF